MVFHSIEHRDSFIVLIRISMSIPIFFETIKLKDKKGKTHVIVDGGV